MSGLKRGEMLVPGLHVDDAEAFLDQSTPCPRWCSAGTGGPASSAIRWYKMTSEVTAGALGPRPGRAGPGPAGGDRRRVERPRPGPGPGLAAGGPAAGDRPLLLITTATADEVTPDPDAAAGGPGAPAAKLIDVYDERSFRFCFTNRQMAEAVTDFVFGTGRCGPARWSGRGCGWHAGGRRPVGRGRRADGPVPRPPPHVFAVAWQDDPYSADLAWQFRYCIHRRFGPGGAAAGRPAPRVPRGRHPVQRRQVLHAQPARGRERRRHRPRGPAAARPAGAAGAADHRRRRPGGSCGRCARPRRSIDRRLVAVTGDGMGVNTIYRDGEFAWPVRSLPIPLVLFTHNDPFAWDAPGAARPRRRGTHSRRPNSTEDVLHFTEIGRVVAEAAFPAAGDRRTDGPPRRRPGRRAAGAGCRAGRRRSSTPTGTASAGTGESRGRPAARDGAEAVPGRPGPDADDGRLPAGRPPAAAVDRGRRHPAGAPGPPARTGDR